MVTYLWAGDTNNKEMLYSKYPPANPIFIGFMSAVFPGSGQLNNKQYWKALGFFMVGAYSLTRFDEALKSNGFMSEESVNASFLYLVVAGYCALDAFKVAKRNRNKYNELVQKSPEYEPFKGEKFLNKYDDEWVLKNMKSYYKYTALSVFGIGCSTLSLKDQKLNIPLLAAFFTSLGILNIISMHNVKIEKKDKYLRYLDRRKESGIFLVIVGLAALRLQDIMKEDEYNKSVFDAGAILVTTSGILFYVNAIKEPFYSEKASTPLLKDIDLSLKIDNKYLGFQLSKSF